MKSILPQDLYEMNMIADLRRLEGEAWAFQVLSPCPEGYITRWYRQELGSTPMLMDPDTLPRAETAPFNLRTVPHGPIASPGAVVWEDLPCLMDGKPVTGGQHQELWIYRSEYSRGRRISPAKMDVSASAYSSDGRFCLFAARSFAGAPGLACSLYLYDAEKDSLSTIHDEGEGWGFHTLRFLGREFFYAITQNHFLGESPLSRLLDPISGIERSLPFLDMPFSGGAISDMIGSTPTPPLAMGPILYYTSPTPQGSALFALNVDGALRPVVQMNGHVLHFLPLNRGVVFSALLEGHLPELYYTPYDSYDILPLTELNKTYESTHVFHVPEYHRWKGFDGGNRDGWVVYPTGYEPKGSVPAVFMIHGGPGGLWNHTFFHEIQCLASAGFLVFYCNPHGSWGKGEEFARIRRLNGQREDIADLEQFVKDVLSTVPGIDRDRVGITGGSYGGQMTNYFISQSNQFAAAVSCRSFGNYFTKILCSDNGYNVSLRRVEADLWKDFPIVWEASPLSCAHKICTPTLFLHSLQDRCCPAIESIQLVNLLKAHGVEAELFLFDGESHNLSRQGSPCNRVQRLQLILDWFSKYLTSKQTDSFFINVCSKMM